MEKHIKAQTASHTTRQAKQSEAKQSHIRLLPIMAVYVKQNQSLPCIKLVVSHSMPHIGFQSWDTISLGFGVTVVQTWDEFRFLNSHVQSIWNFNMLVAGGMDELKH